MDRCDSFIEKVIERDVFQAKYLKDLKLTDEQKKEFCVFLLFCEDMLCKSIDELVDAYMFLNRMCSEETKFFVENGRYRYSYVKDVENMVYNDSDYMEKYMLGLSLSQYLWKQHTQMYTFFGKCLSSLAIERGGGVFRDWSRMWILFAQGYPES